MRAGKRDAWVRLDAYLPVERESALAVTLVQGIAATDAMDTIVRRAVELGVAAIQPVVSARGARFPGGAHGEKRLAHWRQVAVAACEQCGRNRVPAVHDVTDLADWLRARDATRPGIVLDPEAAAAIAAHAVARAGVRPADRARRRPHGRRSDARDARGLHGRAHRPARAAHRNGIACGVGRPQHAVG